MPSYVITGASRGIGWGFVQHLSADPSNTVIGLVRNAPPTIERVNKELGDRKNITILQADLTDNPSIKKAAEDTAKTTGGSLDYLVASAAYLELYDQFDSPSALIAKSSQEEFARQFRIVMDTNVLAQVFLYEAYLPLLKKSPIKKVLSISSGMGDLETNRSLEFEHAVLYSSSKAALNMVNAKFGVQSKDDGVLFISMCPGMVETGLGSKATPEQLPKIQVLVKKFQEYQPNWTGPYQDPVHSVKLMLSTLSKLSIENGDQGRYTSHLGTDKWL